MVISSIRFQHPTQVLLAEHNNMIHTLATDRSDQSFGKAVLPRRARRNGFVTDAHGSYAARNRSTVDRVPIADQVAWGVTPGEGFGNLLRNPFCRRMWRYVDPCQFSAGHSDDDQNIKQLKAEGRNHEQVHGRDVRRMVTQEGAPALTGW